MSHAKRRSHGIVETLLAPGLDSGSATPLNEQLMTLLQEAILKGSLAAGDRLPASRAMAARLAVSRNTVLAAYDQLTAEGYLETRTGAGTFVSADLPDNYLKLETSTNAPGVVQPSVPSRPLAGMPALDEFPFNLWGRIAGRVWRHANTAMLQHNDPAGYRPLRQAIADYLQAARGVNAQADQIMITSGLQQGLKFVAESILSKSQSIILEDPGYPGLRKTAEYLPQKTLYTQVDEHGACTPAAAVDAHQPGLLLITPSRHYPLGVTMPVSRRLELLDWANAHDAFILEDDYDSEFRYGGRPVQSLQGLDGGNRVIYAGSFSKSLFLALRIGYLVLPHHMAERVIRHREKTASFPALGDQMVLAKFIEEGHFARHLRRLRAIHKSRLDLFFSTANDLLKDHLKLTPTDAGLHIVTHLANKATPKQELLIAQAAHRASLGAIPLSRAYVHEPARYGLLMGFANIPEDEIKPRLLHFRKELDEITGFS